MMRASRHPTFLLIIDPRKRVPFRWKKKRAPRPETTAEQRAAFDELLLGEDLVAAEMAAFEYALSLTGKNEAMATQLVKSARNQSGQ